MTQQEKQILNEYASAKRAESDAKEIVNVLKEQVLDIVGKYTGNEAGDKVEIESGKFSLSKRRKYVYPEHVLSEEEELKSNIKNLKLKSEQIGDGSYEESTSLTFTKNK